MHICIVGTGAAGWITGNKIIFNSVHKEITPGEVFMFYNTTSGKDLNWPTDTRYRIGTPQIFNDAKFKNHLDYFQELHNK